MSPSEAAPLLPQLAPRTPRAVVVEPALVLYMISSGCIHSLRTQFLVRRVAGMMVVTANMTSHTCQVNRSDPAYITREKIQAHTAIWSMYLAMANLIPMILMTLYLGSVSDRHGRRLCLILPAIGTILGAIVDISVIYFNLPIYMLFLEVLETFFGGKLVMKVGCSAYIIDTVPPDRKALRMTILDCLYYVSVAISNISMGYWVDVSGGFLWPYVFVASGSFLTIIYTILCVPETVRQAGTSRGSVNSLAESSGPEPGVRPQGEPPNSLTHFSRGFMLLVYDDSSGRRWKLNVLMGAYAISALSATGHILTLFQLNTPLCWTAAMVGIFSFSDFIFKAFVMVVFVWALKRVVATDLLAVFGRVTSVLEHVYLAFCTSTLMMFFAPAIGFLNLLTGSMTKTLLSELVSTEEQGGIMAVFSMSDVLRTVSGIILSPVYASSLSRMEGLAFLLSASLHVISLVMLAIYASVTRRARSENVPEAARRVGVSEGDDQR